VFPAGRTCVYATHSPLQLSPAHTGRAFSAYASAEVARAVRQTASRKATGPDEVPAELFKAGGETVLDRMHRTCVATWETGEWPEEWTFSTFVPYFHRRTGLNRFWGHGHAFPPKQG